jgi:hypothetical protein
MDDRAKLGAVLLGGYLLGRTKKGGTALRLALRLAGDQASPQHLLSAGASSKQGSLLLEQLRGPVMAALQQALDARLEQLTESITSRTQALSEAGSKATDTAQNTVSDVTGQTGEEEETDESDEQAEDLGEDTSEAEEPAEGDGDQPEDQAAEDEDEPDQQAEEPDQEDPDEVADEPEDEPEEGEDYEEMVMARAKELRRKRITTLRNMAIDDYEFTEDEVADMDKHTLSEEIAYAELELENDEEDS